MPRVKRRSRLPLPKVRPVRSVRETPLLSPIRVGNPASFNGLFKHGDKILTIHLDRAQKRSLTQALRDLRHLFPMWKSWGYVGAFGDTPNVNVTAYALERMGGIIIDPPPKAQREPRDDFKNACEREDMTKNFPTNPCGELFLFFSAPIQNPQLSIILIHNSYFYLLTHVRNFSPQIFRFLLGLLRKAREKTLQ